MRKLTGKAIGAEHQAVTGAGGQNPEVRFPVVAGTQRAGNHVAARVGQRLQGGNLTLVNQVLHLGVVARDLLQRGGTLRSGQFLHGGVVNTVVFTQQTVGSGVTHVENNPQVTVTDAGQPGASDGRAASAGECLLNFFVGFAENIVQAVQGAHDFVVEDGVGAATTLGGVGVVNGGEAFSVGLLLLFATATGHGEERRVGKLTHAQARCYFAGFVASHAVRDHAKGTGNDHRIFVIFSMCAAVRCTTGT